MIAMPIDLAGDFVWLKTSEKISYCCTTGKLETDCDHSAIIDALSSGLSECKYYLDDVVAFGFGDQERPFDLFLINRNCEVAFIWSNDVVVEKPVNEIFAFIGNSLHEKVKMLEDLFLKKGLKVTLLLDKISFQTSMSNEA